MKPQLKDSIDSLAKDKALDQPTGMIIELDGAVLEQIGGGKTQPWTI